VELEIRKLRGLEDLKDLLQSGLNQGLVVISVHGVVKDKAQLAVALVRLGSVDGGLTHRGELTLKGLGVLDTGRIVQAKDTNDITSIQSGTGLLDELNNTILGSDQWHVHFHDLNLGIGLS